MNKIYSDKSPLQYKYADLPFACPSSGRVRTRGFTSGASLSLNIGEVLRGDRIVLSDYELFMGKDEEIRHLCDITVDRAGLERTKELIHKGYKAEWIVDNLPGATSFQTTDKRRKYYVPGFKIGEEVTAPGTEPQYFLNNHVTIVIRYHHPPDRSEEHNEKVIVGFEIFPKSISGRNRTGEGLPVDTSHVSYGFELIPRSNNTDEIDYSEDATVTIPFSYSVYFVEDEQLEWRNRWDMYFAQDDSTGVHWLALVNSIVITGMLTALVAVIVARTVHGDIKAGSSEDKRGRRRRRSADIKVRRKEKSYSLVGPTADVEADGDFSSDDDSLEDAAGWKLLHGDVFRPPQYGDLLAPLIGSGIQLLFMTVAILLLGLIGVLNPSFRGGYISVGVGLFIFAGVFSGYFSSRAYKSFGGKMWVQNSLVTASLVPGLLFCTIFIINLFVWMQASSNAIPFSTLIALIALWLFFQLPLVYISGWYGYAKVDAWSPPIKANLIPRQVPHSSWLRRSTQTVILAGAVPFLVVFVELMFVFDSLWQETSSYYYLFGFLSMVATILAVTVIEVSIVATYLQLCDEVSRSGRFPPY